MYIMYNFLNIENMGKKNTKALQRTLAKMF